jgi:hypothetical protein
MSSARRINERRSLFWQHFSMANRIKERKPYDSRKKSTTIETVKHAALLLIAAWILWNHTINPDSSQETWTPLSQFKSMSSCVETARGVVKRHISTPRTIEGSTLISPDHQPQKLLVYMGDNLVAAISYECAPSTQNPRLVNPAP